MVTYDRNGAYVQFLLSNYTTEVSVQEAINLIPDTPGSDYNNEPAYALQLINSTVFNPQNIRPTAQLVVVLVTDSPSAMPAQELAARNALFSRGVHLIAISANSNSVQLRELRSIASSITDVISVNGYQLLLPQVDQLASIMCPNQQGLSALFR